MKYKASLLIIYYITTCAVIKCQISEQQSCMDDKQAKCQSELDEKVNHLHSGLITPELCCPAIEARDCLRAALRECGFPKSSEPMLRPADCSKYDDSVTCKNGSAVIAHSYPHNSEDNGHESETIVEKKHESADGNENSNELVEDTNYESNNNNNDDVSVTVGQHIIDEHREEDTIEGNKLEESDDNAMSESKQAEHDASSNSDTSGTRLPTISSFSLFIAAFLIISRS